MKITFGLYGSGWRSEFFLRVAKALPDRFEAIGVVTRSDEKADRFGREFGVRCYKTAGDLLAAGKPVIQILNVNRLYESYGLVFDQSGNLLAGGDRLLRHTRLSPLVAFLPILGMLCLLFVKLAGRKRRL